MKKKVFTEQELLEALDAESAHADELFKLLPQELTPLELLKGSVIGYERPFDSVWDDSIDSNESVEDDLSANGEPPKGRE